jgi:hypothetical protein
LILFPLLGFSIKSESFGQDVHPYKNAWSFSRQFLIGPVKTQNKILLRV